MTRPATSTHRMPLMDAIKAAGCLAVVAHHLAFYGPMSDVAYPLSQPLFDGLYAYGRMAVQAFLVVAGFLCAMQLGPQGGASASTFPWRAIGKRYLRLVVPLAAALTLAIVCNGIARRWMTHESISAVPNPWQLFAHVLFLQDLVDQEALSAGVWYLAVDFQLFTMMALMLAITARAGLRSMGMVAIAGLTWASLIAFNRDDLWDETGLYYLAYYGLGALVFWATEPSVRRPQVWLGLLAACVVAALLVDYRVRIVVAAAVAGLLAWARWSGGLARWQVPDIVSWLGRISFSIFLVHFPVCLVINAAVSRFLPATPLINALGLIAAFFCSIAAGAVFYRLVEGRRFNAWEQGGVVALFLGVGLAAWKLGW
ncbi:hypothetical protein GCM10007242_47940 [Pigmentiphaga litoralis]|uniref:acyltransferase family protein n=1 Tax=Pigmentiphaga litoralis TaxID=516702 RepID=UPI001679CA5A|nr:acyltransferase [Pigmentiphaga litoralis]GGX35308.1 hypothetical protein GCM10007242_47940 [Pigmentiphaga litoralis]